MWLSSSRFWVLVKERSPESEFVFECSGGIWRKNVGSD